MDAFVKIFGSRNTIKVFGYLVDLNIDVSIQDIMDGTDLSRKTVEKILYQLVEYNMIKETRTIGKTRMYKLNKNNFIVKRLISLNKDVIKEKEKMLTVSSY